MNRTVTNRGKNKLASLLNQSQRTEEEIISRQQAIQELSGELNWRQHYLAKGKETEDQKNQLRIDDSIGQLIQLKSAQTIKYLLKTLPLLTILLIGLNSTGIFPNSIYLIAIFSQWVLFILYSKTISRFHKQFESQAKRLSRYANMLQQIETKPFRSSYLILLNGKLISKGKKASNEDAVGQLAALGLQPRDLVLQVDAAVGGDVAQLLDLRLEFGDRLFEIEETDGHRGSARLGTVGPPAD